MPQQANLKTEFTKIKTMHTPDGEAAFAYLRKPDDAFGKEKFRITVFFDKDSDDFKAWVKVLRAMNKKFLVSVGKLKSSVKAPLPKCIKVANDKLAETCGVDVGTPYIQFETKPRKDDNDNWIPVPVYGADGSLTRKLVYGTDIVSVEANVTGWINAQGAGLKCYLAAVQLLESRYEGGAGNAGSTFGKRDEYITDDEGDDATGSEDVSDVGLEDEDNDDLAGLGEGDEDPSGGLV